MIPWINMGEWPSWLQVYNVEQIYGAQAGGACLYVGSMCVSGRSGGYSDTPVEIFWQEKRARPEYSHYFGLYRQGGQAMITNAGSVAEGVWAGMMCDETGEIVFSRYRHDMRHSKTGRFFVDGGRDYMRSGGTGGIHVLLKVVGPRMHYIVPADHSAAVVDRFTETGERP